MAKDSKISPTKSKSRISVIGSGFAGLSAAAVLAKQGVEVTVFEKNATIGGRARTMKANGFLFDMGPSWYWMPDVYERFYNIFGHSTSDFYDLKKLDPGFRVIFAPNDFMDIPQDFDQLCALFETIEKGSATQLKKFMDQAAVKYEVGMSNMVYMPGHSAKEFLSLSLFKDALKLQIFSSFSKHIRRYFKNPRLITLMEFPVLFLGAMPQDTPALYSLMNYAGLKQGTFYPAGGFGKVVDAFATIAKEQGVNIKTKMPIDDIEVHSGRATHVHSKNTSTATDGIIASADYHHVESKLLSKNYRNYNEAYWDKKVFAPSCLIFYLGINKKINRLSHHNLFFDEDLDAHAVEIYKTKQWPKKPLFYVCCPSKSDLTVAPEGNENIFILMPIAAGLKDSKEMRAHYYEMLMERLEKFAGEDIRGNVSYKSEYAVANFISDYNAYKGNAYGLANTLMQTAIFKPKMRSKLVKNLYFSGQLTVPGPGVPPSIISGQIAANELLKYLKT